MVQCVSRDRSNMVGVYSSSTCSAQKILVFNYPMLTKSAYLYKLAYVSTYIKLFSCFCLLITSAEVSCTLRRSRSSTPVHRQDFFLSWAKYVCNNMLYV